MELGQILKANFRITEYWGTKTEQEKHRIRELVKLRFSNGHSLDDRFLNRRISLSLNDRRNYVREKMRNYLLDFTNQKPEKVKEAGCPDGLDPEGWEAWIDAELAFRAWSHRRDCQRVVSEAEARLAAGEEVKDMARLKRKLSRWTGEVAALGEPPKSILDAVERVKKRAAVTHRMGQGGSLRLKAQFVSPVLSSRAPFFLSRT